MSTEMKAVFENKTSAFSSINVYINCALHYQIGQGIVPLPNASMHVFQDYMNSKHV